ncbi:MAG: trypsin-like serine protease [Fibrobacterota bacterium]|nr:trypsin-like serine protease [Fibrobacterota bacterium]QQS06136.1 MAG: trypsin-like serine protease [Fibrobacterota bacterium]
MRRSKLFYPATIVFGLAATGRCASVSHAVVVRDHLKATSSEIVINGSRGDSTAGSWAGTLPGIEGLPTPTISLDPPYILLRHPLQTTDQAPGWPGRIAGRLDLQAEDGSFRPQCSGSLVGPNFFLTAAHCVVAPTSISSIQEEWVTDSYYVRPSLDRGHDHPGFSAVRVVKSYVSKSVFPIAPSYDGDNDWAILELASDVGTRLGWAQVVPMTDDRENKPVHMLGYPIFPPDCGTGKVCDTATRRDTLHHSWSYLWRYNFGSTQDWYPQVHNWRGESGSGAFDCPDNPCRKGTIRVRATLWKERALSAIDSTISGVLASILKDVKVPVSAMRSSRSFEPDLKTRWTAAGLEVETDRVAQLEVLDANGRSLARTGQGTSWTLGSLNKKGVLLLVARYGNGLTKTATVVPGL